MNFKLNLRDREILKQVQDDGEGGDPESHSAIKRAVECHSGPDPEPPHRHSGPDPESLWLGGADIGLEFAVL